MVVLFLFDFSAFTGLTRIISLLTALHSHSSCSPGFNFQEHGHPKKEIPIELVTILTVKGVPKNMLARELGCSKATLYKHLNQWHLGNIR
jgi:hypothetical protein